MSAKIQCKTIRPCYACVILTVGRRIFQQPSNPCKKSFNIPLRCRTSIPKGVVNHMKTTASNIQQLLSSLLFHILLHQSKHFSVHVTTINGKLSKLLIIKVTTNWFKFVLYCFSICMAQKVWSEIPRLNFISIPIPDSTSKCLLCISLFRLSWNNFFNFFYLFIIFFFIASKTHTERKQKLHRINKVIKRKNKQKKTTTTTNSEFTHLHGNILTNIKIRYSSANSIYYCT